MFLDNTFWRKANQHSQLTKREKALIIYLRSWYQAYVNTHTETVKQVKIEATGKSELI